MGLYKLALARKRYYNESQADLPPEMQDQNINQRAPGASKRVEPHLMGLKGIFAVQSLVWIYFATFIPALVYPGANGPVYQRLLRDIFSVPFWNGSLISSFFVFLSLRTVGITYLRKPSSTTYAGTLVRRIIRMMLLLSIASGIATGMVTSMGGGFVDEFKARLPNNSFPTPGVPYNGIAAANSIFDLFWLTTDFSTQAANRFWPSATLWAPAVIYYESFTIYIIMVVMPYTRPAWHWQVLALFALGSFWYQSWGWYAATALALADAASNATLSAEIKLGLKLRKGTRVPTWAVSALVFAIGLALKYFTTIVPRFEHSLLVLHPFLDLSQSQTPSTFAAQGPYPRLDDYLIIAGFFAAMESLDVIKKILSARILVSIGERAFSESSQHPVVK